jgi:uncharacterized protein YjbI with pentapeptide repeats
MIVLSPYAWAVAGSAITWLLTRYIMLRRFRLAEESAYVTRLRNAASDLASDRREVRVGAALALERLAEDSPRDAVRAFHLLIAFIRQHAQRNGNRHRVDADVETAVAILLRLAERSELRGRTIDLRGVDLCGVAFDGVQLSRANLAGSAFGKPELTTVSTTFSRAQLVEADLRHASLVGVDFWAANLRDADLSHAHLNGAWLIGADLRGANLRGASLRGAHLAGARLRGANLASADLTEATGLTRSEVAHCHRDARTVAPTTRASAEDLEAALRARRRFRLVRAETNKRAAAR